MKVKNAKEISSRCRSLYQRAVEAGRKRNFDYAISMYAEILSEEPYFLDARREMRRAAIDKFGGKPSTMKQTMVKMKYAMALSVKIPGLIKKEQVLEALVLLEEVIALDPSNSQALRLVADCAPSVAMEPVAIDALEQVMSFYPDDITTAEILVELYMANGMAHKGVDLCRKLLKLDKENGTLQSLLKNSEARNAMAKSSWEQQAEEPEEQAAETVARPEQRGSQENPSNSVKDLDEEQLKNLIENGQADVEVYKRYAQALMRRDEYNAAIEALKLAIETLPGELDLSLQRLIYQATEKMLNFALDSWENHKNSTADEEQRAEAQVQIDHIKQQQSEFLLQKARDQAAIYSREPAVQMKLAKLLFEAGIYEESFAPLSKASTNSRYRKEALYMRGIGRYRAKDYEVAIRDLRSAIECHEEDPEKILELLFAMGTSQQKFGKKEDSEETFARLDTLSPGYRESQTVAGE